MQTITGARLEKQLYGLAMSQCTFGGPKGVWLECTACDDSQRIVGSNNEAWLSVPDSDVAKVFRRHGWTGRGDLFVEPGDRDAAITQCKNRLTIAQVGEIRFAPSTALIRISYVEGQPGATVLVIPEG